MCVPDSAQHTVDYSDWIDGLSAMLKGGLLLFELNRDAALRQNHDSNCAVSSTAEPCITCELTRLVSGVIAGK